MVSGPVPTVTVTSEDTGAGAAEGVPGSAAFMAPWNRVPTGANALQGAQSSRMRDVRRPRSRPWRRWWTHVERPGRRQRARRARAPVAPRRAGARGLDRPRPRPAPQLGLPPAQGAPRAWLRGP